MSVGALDLGLPALGGARRTRSWLRGRAARSRRATARPAEAELAEIVRVAPGEHQPGGPNAGSVFTNPPGDSAGRLIDAAGGKGLRLGTAEVSTKHANFIQADAAAGPTTSAR